MAENRKLLLGSDIHKDLIYNPDSIPNFNYERDLGDAGEQPFTRGIHSNMYRGKEFTCRQLTGHGSPKDTNEKMRFMLDNGATGLNILFDIPTIQMYDSDDKFSIGQVGLSGVSIDSIEDMHILFKNIKIDKTTISLVTHYPSNTAILFSMFLAYAEEIGVSWKDLRGSVQNDTTLEELVRSGVEFISPKDCFRIQCDNVEFIRKNIPKWNVVTLNGYNLREFGTSAITESAIAMANGMATIKELRKRGLEPDFIANRISFFWSVSNDFFEEIARLRAVRRLWARIMKERFDVKDERSMWMRCHVQTSGGSLMQQEPLNNIVRSSYQALAAVLGGAQSLHVDSFDEAYSIPTSEAALISLRTQQIIQEETGVTEVVDPLGGSYYIESLTNEIEKRIEEELEEIESKGGYLKIIESGEIRGRIFEYFVDQQKKIESGEISIVAKNKYMSKSKKTIIKTFDYSTDVETSQIEHLYQLRMIRDSKKANDALDELQEACKQRLNIFPFCIECAKARCTEGEMFKVFKKSLGLWNPPSFW